MLKARLEDSQKHKKKKKTPKNAEKINITPDSCVDLSSFIRAVSLFVPIKILFQPFPILKSKVKCNQHALYAFPGGYYIFIWELYSRFV